MCVLVFVYIGVHVDVHIICVCECFSMDAFVCLCLYVSMYACIFMCVKVCMNNSDLYLYEQYLKRFIFFEASCWSVFLIVRYNLCLTYVLVLLVDTK